MKKKYIKPMMDVEECSQSYFLLVASLNQIKANDDYDITYGGVDDGDLDPE